MTGEISMGDVDAPIVIEVKRPASVRSEVTLDDYEEVGGIMWAYTRESGIKGQDERQTLTIESIDGARVRRRG